MFIKIHSKDELIAYLEDYSSRQLEVVIHYNCSTCDDEQVTYAEVYEDYQIEKIRKNGYLMVTLECTSCGTEEKFIHMDKIQGIEVWE